MQKPIAIYWLRQDLRLTDNPALIAAAQDYQVLPIYIVDDVNANEAALGAASQVWLHHSLLDLEQQFNGQLSVYKGDPLTIVNDLIKRLDIKAVCWNRCYEPWRIARDTKIKATLEEQGVTVKRFNGSLLWEPWQIKKQDGTPYKVFTPYYRKGCLLAEPPRFIAPKPDNILLTKDSEQSLSIDSLSLLPATRSWHLQMLDGWQISEAGAQAQLRRFLDHGIQYYKGGRDLPAKPFTSRLAPYLHFGQLSPNQAWYMARQLDDNEHIDHFCSELGWREFSNHLLYANPSLRTDNLQQKFDAFPWAENTEHLKAWQRGMTGIPMVDAGMRELWQTGYMHNRVRMVVGSFLVKNLRLHWHHGERWFWDCLFDADLANNSASWQWIAGCGADAAPYFRIFNPVTQGQRFDPEGDYIRQYIPELSALPNKYLFNPWEAPEAVLTAANVRLGSTYPQPIVDLKESRQAALAAFSSLKNQST